MFKTGSQPDTGGHAASCASMVKLEQKLEYSAWEEPDCFSSAPSFSSQHAHTQDWLPRPSLLGASPLSPAADFFFLLYKTYDKCTNNKKEAWPLFTHKPNSMNSCSLSHHLKPDKGIAFRPMAAEKTAGIRRGSGPEIPRTSVMMAN